MLIESIPTINRQTGCRSLCSAGVVATPQVRKNTNQTTPRMSTASPVETARRASTDGPRFGLTSFRRSFDDAALLSCCHDALDCVMSRAPSGASYRKQRVIPDDVPAPGRQNQAICWRLRPLRSSSNAGTAKQNRAALTRSRTSRGHIQQPSSPARVNAVRRFPPP